MDRLVQDLKYSYRSFLKNPGFAAAAVLTLALGIGANTAIFSITNAVLLRELPVPDPDRLAVLYTTCRRGAPRCSSSYPDYLDYRDRSRSFADLAAYSWVPLNVGDASSARLATGQLVTGNYFEVLGAMAASGRLIQPRDHVRGGTAVAVLSYEMWRDAFASDPDLVGATLLMNNVPFEVIGVAPPGFKGLDLGGEVDVWIPMVAGPLLGVGFAADDDRFDARGNRWIDTLFGRLVPGATVEGARAEMLAISQQLAEEDPEARGPRSVTVDPAPRYILPVSNQAAIRQFVLLLLGVVGIALLLAAANLANLLIARASARRREIGIRLAIGAGRGRLIQQLVTEAVALALAGGTTGLILAMWMIDLLSGFQLPGSVAISALAIGFDAPVFTFAFVLSVFTGLLFGLLPALQATRADIVTSLKGQSSDRASGGQRVRKSLVAVQVALCLVLLIGSGLFLRSLRNSLAFDAGFRTENVALARFNLALLRYTPERANQFVDGLLERVRALPGVDAASVATLVPFQRGGYAATSAEVRGYERATDEEIRVNYVMAGPDYFRALGGAIAEGRAIQASDVDGTRPVVVINEYMAQRYWPGRSAVGGVIELGGTIEAEVVGVAGDFNWRALGEAITPYVFLPLALSPGRAADGFLTLVARTTGDAGTVLPLIREEFRALDPGLSLTTLQTMDGAVERFLMPQRMGATLLTLFGVLTLIMAAVGIYGVVSFTITRQARDIGIRIALGARNHDVLALITLGMALPILVGLAAGLGAALVLNRSVAGFMFGISPSDPLTFIGFSLALCGIAFLATLVPARRATRVDPMTVLASE